MVATRFTDRRSVRQTSEQNDSIDGLIKSLRAQGFRVGVVVDEAHHGFHGDTQAAIFFREVLRPEYTILITATPDDEDIRDLQTRMQLGHLHRISISRTDAVGPGPEAGLIKNGIKTIAWRAEEGRESLVDFEETALREATSVHKAIKAELASAHISLTPLMLVQVDSKPKSVDRAKEKLKALGFTDAQLATHTSDEPDPALLAIANDESREVLIFKMAVALGFDAPRAFTLVSMRASQDDDFGVQLVGRILRVHRRLQGKRLPEVLKYGYVLLADYDSQGGIDRAGQRINQLQTAYAALSPTTVIVQIGNRTMVQQVGSNGQLSLAPVPPEGAVYLLPHSSEADATVGPSVIPSDGSAAGTLFGNTDLPVTPTRPLTDVGRVTGPSAALLNSITPTGQYRYALRTDVPRVFMTQDVPEDVEISEQDVAHHFIANADELIRAIGAQRGVQLQKQTLEIFTRELQQELAFGAPSPDHARREAQRVLVQSGMFSAKVLREQLVRRLREDLAHRGFADASDTVAVSRILDMLIAARPAILREAERKALATAMRVSQADPLPNEIVSDSPLITSRLNVYGVLPNSSFNDWERRFATDLDADHTGTVLWWHRNPPRKSYSINVLMDNGRGFFPDFIVGIRDRRRTDHGLLADTKFAWESSMEYPKLLAEHEAYGKALILTRDSNSPSWQIVGLDTSGRPKMERPFRITEATRY
jgi:hypothetical protein